MIKNTFFFVFYLFCISTQSMAQIITTIAGTGLSSNSGNGGPATEASFGIPAGIVIDHNGNLYITDEVYNCVRKINASGIIYNFAGNGGIVYSGDGGPATAASIAYPGAIAIDDLGNIYVGDGNNYVRKIDISGIISTVAGSGLPRGYSGDGGPATLAKLYGPAGLAVDQSGSLYIIDVGNSVIRKVQSGVITTFAGTGVPGYSGDGGPASSAQLRTPQSLAVDCIGNVYIGDSLSFIRKVDTNGIITTIAGIGPFGFSGDGGPATAAEFYTIDGLATDCKGDIFLSDGGNNRVRVIEENGIVTSYAGNGIQGFSGDGGPANLAELNIPGGLAVDSVGTIYIADGFNSRIRKVTAPTSIKPINEPTTPIKIYPNPTTGPITITLPQTNESKTIIIRNILGTVIESRTSSSSQPQQFHLPAPPGAYFAEVISGSEVFRQQFTVW